jgi:protein-tyrosine-phosphatase/DNA-binding transcriptional ArsR family regulator
MIENVRVGGILPTARPARLRGDFMRRDAPAVVGHFGPEAAGDAMTSPHAMASLAALGQPTRLEIVGLLMRHEPEGLAAGAIAAAVECRHNTLSTHLSILARCGLVRGQREGRSIVYRVDIQTMRSLLAFLVMDCCAEHPALRGFLGEAAARCFNVLFICTENSVRSIMAEAIMNRAGRGKFRAFSAGSTPSGQVHPYAIELLEQLHFDTSSLRSKNWKEFAEAGAPEFDFVFTVCDRAANEVRPVWPGQPMTAHWGMPDPAAATVKEAEIPFVFADALHMLTDRINLLMGLPISSLDQLTLQKRIEAIGKSKDRGEDPASAAR